MGLTLNAVVVMANNVGCVCTPTGHAGTASIEGGSAAAGMVTLLAQQQQQQAAAAQHH
jgi:hypothetical protein